MGFKNTGKSVGLVGLLLTSLLMGLMTVPAVSAVNETSNGTITTTSKAKEEEDDAVAEVNLTVPRWRCLRLLHLLLLLLLSMLL